MAYQIHAEIQIDDTVFTHFISLDLIQDYHDHHSFEIRVPFHHLERYQSIDLLNTHQLVGKVTIIKFFNYLGDIEHLLFKGIVTDVSMVSSDNFRRDIIIKGYSPTILLENGKNYCSHLEKDVPTIVADTTTPLNDFGTEVDASTYNFSNPYPYVVQYNESAYNFLNRLANDTFQLFYYDGVTLFFGHPIYRSSLDTIYSFDLLSYQIKYQIVPLRNSRLKYDIDEDQLLTEDAPDKINANLSNISNSIFNTSYQTFNAKTQTYLELFCDDANDIKDYVEKEEFHQATKIKTISGSSINPDFGICKTIDVKIFPQASEGNSQDTQQQGSFFLTRVHHKIDENGQYRNEFEGLTSELGTYPPKKHTPVTTEIEMAKVVDNDDPYQKGRVKVQTFWQENINETSRWISVMTPDAGGGDNNAGNRGFVAIPEVGDLVLVNYAMNNPNYPFVHGSLFNGNAAGGGGSGNSVKSITARNGATFAIRGTQLVMDNLLGDYIDVNDGNITIGTDDLLIQVKNVIRLEVGDSFIEVLPDKITIHSPTVKVEASDTADIQGNKKAVIKQTDSNCFKAEGNNAEITGTKVTVTATAQAELTGAMTKVNASGITEVNGAMVNING